MQQQECLNRIQEKLELLKSIDLEFTIFGSKNHQYALNPRLTNKEIIAFENKQKVSLPEDYKAFLLQIGNGGVGPYYGLEKLEKSLCSVIGYELEDYPSDIDMGEMSVYLNPSLPFQYTELVDFYKENKSIYEKMDEAIEKEDHDLYEKLDEEEMQIVWNAKHTNGVLNLCDYGCGIRIFLVVNGAEKGFVWTDDRANDKEIRPFHYFGNKERLKFLEWYELWLDISLRELQNIYR